METVHHHYEGKHNLRTVGRCIYCDSTENLTDEHIVPYSLGADGYLKDASCAACADITKRFELHVARNVFGHLRIHRGIQTRNPKQRPKVLPITIIRNGQEETREVKVSDHFMMVRFPRWDGPTILFGEEASPAFKNPNFRLLFTDFAAINKAFGIPHDETVEIKFGPYIDPKQFARCILKIAYCHAVAVEGLDRINPLNVREAILGNYECLPEYVGAVPGDPLPPDTEGREHLLSSTPITVNGIPYLLGGVRLFASTGTEKDGSPIYRAIVGQLK